MMRYLYGASRYCVVVWLFLVPIVVVSSRLHAVSAADSEHPLRGIWRPSAVVVDQHGLSHMVVQQREHSQAKIYYVQARGRTLVAVEQVSHTASWSWNPAILLYQDAIFIAWQDDHDGDDHVYLRSRHSAGAWTSPQKVSDAGGAQHPRLQVRDATVHLEWLQDMPSGAQMVGCRWDGEQCSTITRLGPPRGAGVEATHARHVHTPPQQPLQDATRTERIFLPNVTSSSPLRTLAFIGHDSNLWTVYEDGSNLRRLTTTAAVTSFAWSPSGTSIAYVGRENDIYLMNSDGSNPRPITAGIQAHGWALDWVGSRILFVRDYRIVSYVDVHQPGVVTDVATLPFGGFGIHHPSLWPTLRWSPDGTWITSETLLPGTSAVVAPTGAHYREYAGWEPNWKHDSSRIIYVPFTEPGIRLLDPVSGSSVRVSGAGATFATYSPNDRYIAYTTDKLWRMNSDGSSLVLLASHPAADPVWSPNGDKLAFATWHEAGSFYDYDKIYVVNADGTTLLPIAMGHHPAWQPHLP